MLPLFHRIKATLAEFLLGYTNCLNWTKIYGKPAPPVLLLTAIGNRLLPDCVLVDTIGPSMMTNLSRLNKIKQAYWLAIAFDVFGPVLKLGQQWQELVNDGADFKVDYQYVQPTRHTLWASVHKYSPNAYNPGRVCTYLNRIMVAMADSKQRCYCIKTVTTVNMLSSSDAQILQLVFA